MIGNGVKVRRARVTLARVAVLDTIVIGVLWRIWEFGNLGTLTSRVGHGSREHTLNTFFLEKDR